jgi:hypothetical protein
MHKKPKRLPKCILTLLCLFVFYGMSYTQSRELQVVSTGGGYAEMPQLSMSWTIGEISTSTQSNSSIITTQGFQQSFPLLLSSPVELLDFDAQKIDKTVELNWQTASERNNAGFDLERSGNAGDWEPIGYVEGHGNSNELQQYSYLDKEPVSGYNYYRLKQIDLDGEYEYSSICYVLFTGNTTAGLNVYPNPNSGQFTISINNPAGKRAVLQLFTSSGSLIWKQHFSIGEMPKHWEKEFTLEQGEIYFIVSQVGGELLKEKVVVINKD